MTGARPLWVMGDVHGEPAKLRALLRHAGLIGDGDVWTGGGAVLVCIGDYTDRGPDGVGVLDLLLRVDEDAARAGGRLYALLGNHETLLLAAHAFGDHWQDPRGRTFLARWQRAGGRARDLIGLGDAHLAWLARRPAVVRLGPYLFVHADSILYLRYGRTLEGVNGAFQGRLTSRDPLAWDGLVREFSDRGAFQDEDGPARARALLAAYGGEHVVHGHTPIAYQLGVDAAEVHGPLAYAGGLCLNVDGGLAYHPRAGFLVRLGRHGVDRVVTYDGAAAL